MNLFKAARVLVLVTILIIVAADHWLGGARLQSWDGPLWVTVYPINADASPDTEAYIQQLDVQSFADISTFLTREALRYGLSIPQAARFQLAASPASTAPAVPTGNTPFAVAWWSLKMRWWAAQQKRNDGLAPPDVQVFVRYQSSAGQPQLDRSVGLKKGRYMIVNAFADNRMASRNRVVIVHEMMHVLGAIDKYDLANGQPFFPLGLADPQQQPLYPQSRAEIMAGAIALSPNRSVMPASLRECVIGPITAQAIGWAP